MAKPKSNPKLSGQVGDKVYKDGKYGAVVQRMPKGGGSKPGSRSREQNIRTAYLNELASDVNTIIGKYADTFREGGFYQSMQSRFRSEKLNNRFLLLKKLEGLEINSSYPLAKLGKARVTVTARGRKMTVSQDVIYHPSASIKGHKADCYSYELLLLIWVKDEASALPMTKESAWIRLDDEVPFFKYQFDLPKNTMEWLVCVRQILGVDEERIEAFVAEGMQIVLVGTSNKKDLALYEQKKKEAAELLKKSSRKKKKDDENRVQPTKRTK